MRNIEREAAMVPRINGATRWSDMKGGVVRRYRVRTRDSHPQCGSALTLVMGVFALGLAGCVGEQGAAPTLRPADSAIGPLTVTPLNAILAVNDTMQIHVSVQSLSGAALSSVDSVVYQLANVADSLRIRLSRTGLVTAIAASGPGSPVLVNVLAFKDGLVRADQTVLQITDTAIPGATLSIQPIAPDSAKLTVFSNKMLTPVIENTTTDESVPGPTLRLEIRPGDMDKVGYYRPYITPPPNIVSLNLIDGVGAPLNGIVTLSHTGTVWVYANVLVYGTMLHDSVQYTITNGYRGSVAVGDQGSLALVLSGQMNVAVSPGGVVAFFNNMSLDLNTTVDFTFDVPGAATADPDGDGTSGNILGLPGGGTGATRQFLTPGTYQWTATVRDGIAPYTGQTVGGTIVVQ